ncbi:MAG: hypothetical protein HY660_09675, partial [Armatimonadetes bacterium]|nr:hypothetical protein [Armatimonadota bacterium]
MPASRLSDPKAALPIRAHETLRGKLIDFASMPARLRVLVAGGIAAVLGGLLLLALKDVLGPSVQVTTYGGKAVSIAPLFLGAIALLMILAWTYILTGSITAHPAVRLIAVGLFVVAALPVARAAGRVPGGEVVLALAAVYVLWRGRLGGARTGRDTVVLGVLLGVLHGLAALGAFRGDDVALYAVGLST